MFSKLFEKTDDIFKPASDKDVTARRGQKAAELKKAMAKIEGLEVLQEPIPGRMSSFWYDGDIAKLGEFLIVAVGDIRVGFPKQEEESEGPANDMEWLKDEAAVARATEMGFNDRDIEALGWDNNNWFEVGKLKERPGHGLPEIGAQQPKYEWIDLHYDPVYDYEEAIELLTYAYAESKSELANEAMDIFKPISKEDVYTRTPALLRKYKVGATVVNRHGLEGKVTRNTDGTIWIKFPGCGDAELGTAYSYRDALDRMHLTQDMEVRESEDIFKAATPEDIAARKKVPPEYPRCMDCGARGTNPYSISQGRCAYCNRLTRMYGEYRGPFFQRGGGRTTEGSEDIFKPATDADVQQRDTNRPPYEHTCDGCGDPVHFGGEGVDGPGDEYNVCTECGETLCDSCTRWNDESPYCVNCYADLPKIQNVLRGMMGA